MAPSRGWTPWVTRIAAKPQHLTNETRMATIEVKVPDIGDYRDVPVIELLVAVGDTVNKDQGLVTLESDKATMEVPSPAAGVVRELKVKVGDALSEGSVVAVLEAGATANPPSPPGKGAGGEGSAKPAAGVDPVPSPGPAGHPLPGGEGRHEVPRRSTGDAPEPRRNAVRLRAVPARLRRCHACKGSFSRVETRASRRTMTSGPQPQVIALLGKSDTSPEPLPHLATPSPPTRPSLGTFAPRSRIPHRQFRNDRSSDGETTAMDRGCGRGGELP